MMDLNQPPNRPPPRWPCRWIGDNGEACGKWAQRQSLCQRHLNQRDQQRARIINNDAPDPVGNNADNNNNHEPLNDGENVENVRNQDDNNDATPVGNVDNHADNNNPPPVVDEQTNNAAAAIHNIANNNAQGNNDDTAPVCNPGSSMDNNVQLNDADNDRREVADGQLMDAVVGNETTLTIDYLNNELVIRDERIKQLEAKIGDLELMMAEFSDRNGGNFNCTSIASGGTSRFSDCSRFSQLTVPSKVGDVDEEGGNGDRKQNARKRKHASKDQEGKRDKKEENEKSNGDKKPRARKKKIVPNGDNSTDANGGQISYYRQNFHPSRRSDVSNSEQRFNGAHTGLINSNVICYSNSIFQCLASCADMGLGEEFLRSQPSEEHQHFKLYYEFKSLISSILSNGMDNIDPSKFIDLYKDRFTNVGANEGKWHGNFIKQCTYIFKCIFN